MIWAGRCLRVAPIPPTCRDAFLSRAAALRRRWAFFFGVAFRRFAKALHGLTRRFWCIATFAPNDLRHYEGRDDREV